MNKYEKIAAEFDGDVSDVDKNVLAAVMSDPWAIMPEALDTILLIANRANECPESILMQQGRVFDGAGSVVRDDTAIIPIAGPIFRHANIFTQMSGATSIEMLAETFSKAMFDDDINNIVFDIDSPGGQITGISEMASIIKEASNEKNIVAYISGVGASAAYWLASAAGKILINDTALVGSIGVILTAVKGIDKGIIKIRSSQSPFKQPSPESEGGREQLQKMVDDLAQVFVATIAANRDVSEQTVLDKFGQGGILVGSASVAVGMADRLSSLENVIAGFPGLINEGLIMSDNKIDVIATEKITTDYIKVNHPAIANELIAIGTEKINVDTIRAKGREEGIKAECERQQGIEALRLPGNGELIATMKADTDVTVAVAAIKIIQHEQEGKVVQLAALEADGEKVKAVIVRTGEEDLSPNDKVLSPKDAWAKMSDEAKAEYQNDFESFEAYVEADAEDLISIYSSKN